MTKEQLEDFRAAIEEVNKKYNTPELILQCFIESGLVDADGKLTEHYRSS